MWHQVGSTVSVSVARLGLGIPIESVLWLGQFPLSSVGVLVALAVVVEDELQVRLQVLVKLEISWFDG